MISTNLEGLQLRFAEEKDIPLILDFIKELAYYQKLSHEVVATKDSLQDAIFSRKIAEVLIGEYEGNPIGFALYYYNFSTFIGRPGIYLEDLYIKSEMRGKGIGTIIFQYLARLSKERNCWGIQWSVLDWNEPSIKFYKSLGATALNGWIVNRLNGDALEELAKQF